LALADQEGVGTTNLGVAELLHAEKDMESESETPWCYFGPTMDDEEPKIGTFDLGLISREMNELPGAIYQRIRRERRAQLGEPLFLFLELLVRVSGDTWDTIRFICRDKLEQGRRLEFVYAVPPLTRTLLDSLLTIIFIFDNPDTHIRWYYAGGWRPSSRPRNAGLRHTRSIKEGAKLARIAAEVARRHRQVP
jgi:hypothetical protein